MKKKSINTRKKDFSLSSWKDYRAKLVEDVLNADTKKLSEDLNNTYTAKIDSKDIEISGEKSIVGTDNYDVHASDFVVQFTIDLEHREWGIKSIYINAQKAYGSVFVTLWGNGDESDKESEIDCSQFTLETDITIDSDTITIQSLIVDVETKTIICQ